LLSESTSGNGWILTGLGFPAAENAIDSTGTSEFGKDYFYQYIRNELCVRSCRNWSSGTGAGVWNVYWTTGRAYSGSDVGLRMACIPE
jgi:hypothetical protein